MTSNTPRNQSPTKLTYWLKNIKVILTMRSTFIFQNQSDMIKVRFCPTSLQPWVNLIFGSEQYNVSSVSLRNKLLFRYWFELPEFILRCQNLTIIYIHIFIEDVLQLVVDMVLPTLFEITCFKFNNQIKYYVTSCSHLFIANFWNASLILRVFLWSNYLLYTQLYFLLT